MDHLTEKGSQKQLEYSADSLQKAIREVEGKTDDEKLLISDLANWIGGEVERLQRLED
jgi:hypothetical protein